MPEQESDCEYRKTCHFYNIKQLTPANRRLKEIYCIEWPKKCAIYQARYTGVHEDDSEIIIGSLIDCVDVFSNDFLEANGD